MTSSACRMALFMLACMQLSTCKIQSSGPYWMEAQGQGQALRIAASPSGVVVIGTDRRLWSYPGPWARPWVNASAQQLHAIAASQSAIHAIWSDGQVARFESGRWKALRSSAKWAAGAAEIAATADARLFVVASGRVQLIGENQLDEAPCSAVPDVVALAARANEVFVIDQSGALHAGTEGGCARVEAPALLSRIAANTGRILAIDRDGAVWRRPDGGAWTRLPPPTKYRRGRFPFETRATDVSLSTYNSWLLDHEGAIFQLSDGI